MADQWLLNMQRLSMTLSHRPAVHTSASTANVQPESAPPTARHSSSAAQPKPTIQTVITRELAIRSLKFQMLALELMLSDKEFGTVSTRKLKTLSLTWVNQAAASTTGLSSNSSRTVSSVRVQNHLPSNQWPRAKSLAQTSGQEAIWKRDATPPTINPRNPSMAGKNSTTWQVSLLKTVSRSGTRSRALSLETLWTRLLRPRPQPSRKAKTPRPKPKKSAMKSRPWSLTQVNKRSKFKMLTRF